MQHPASFELPSDIRRLALVGVAKNTGKTTTLNWLLGSGLLAERRVGLVSIGIDGESADLLIGTRKPPIHVEEGDWIVTARDALAKSSARVEFVDTLGISTPMGDVVVGRILAPGTVILGGVRHRGDLERALEALERHGVDLCVIDGAYGRTLAARPEISDAVIVSTGAVLANDVPTIVRKTSALVDRLAVERAEVGWQRALIEEAVARERCLLGGPRVDPVELPARSALLGLRKAGQYWSEEIAGVAVPGLVSDGVVEQLLGLPAGEQSVLLVPDGTVLQAKRRLLARLQRRWQVRALETVRVIAIAINPTGIQGHRVDEAVLRAALEQRWPQLSVFNPLHVSGSAT